MKPNKLSLIRTCIAVAAMGCSAVFAGTDYYVVVPVAGRTGAPTISVSLMPATLPSASVGTPYSYSFTQSLQVTGDAAYAGTGVQWRVSGGSLPAGLALSATTGLLTGTPSASGTSSFDVQATYRTKSGTQAYQVVTVNLTSLGTLTTAVGSSTQFGPVQINTTATRDFSFSNTGGQPLTGVQAQVTGTGLTLASNNCGTAAAPVTVPVSGSCTYSVVYAPTAVSTLTGASTTVASSASNGPAVRGLTGQGIYGVLLAHMDGTVADSYGHAWSQKANLGYDTSPWSGQSLAFISSSASTLSYVSSTDFTFGTGDFTMEAWVKPINYTHNGTYGRAVFDLRPDQNNGVYPVLALEKSTGKLTLVLNGSFIYTGTTAVPLNTWSHVAWSRNSGTTRLFLNGAKVGELADTNNYLSTGSIKIGTNAFYSTSPGTNFYGSMDEVRVIKGTGLYTADFAVPTGPFTQ